MISFEGRTVLVTGGTRGIGEAIVNQMVELGANVIATGTHADTIAKLNQQAHAKVTYEAVDFSSDDQTKAFIEKMKSQNIDVLVNNAGINRIAHLPDIKIEDYDLVQKVNLRAPLLLCQGLMPVMESRGYGRIVNVTSIYGHVTFEKRLPYSTSKFGLLGMTKALALEYASKNVLANTVAPGYINTELTRTVLSKEELKEKENVVPMKRLGEPSEIARAVCFLASEANSYMTGQHLIVDGGYTSV